MNCGGVTATVKATTQTKKMTVATATVTSIVLLLIPVLETSNIKPAATALMVLEVVEAVIIITPIPKIDLGVLTPPPTKKQWPSGPT